MRRALLVAGVALVDVQVVAALACLLCRVLDGVVGMHAVTAAAVDGRMIFVLGQGVGVHYRAVGVGEDGAGFSLGGQVLLAAVGTPAQTRGGAQGGGFETGGGGWAPQHTPMSLWQVVHSCVAWLDAGIVASPSESPSVLWQVVQSASAENAKSPVIAAFSSASACEPLPVSLRSAVFGAQPTVPRDISAMTPATAEARTILRRDT